MSLVVGRWSLSSSLSIYIHITVCVGGASSPVSTPWLVCHANINIFVGGNTHKRFWPYPTTTTKTSSSSTTATALCNVILGLKRHQHTEIRYIFTNHFDIIYSMLVARMRDRTRGKSKRKRKKNIFSSWSYYCYRCVVVLACAVRQEQQPTKKKIEEETVWFEEMNSTFYIRNNNKSFRWIVPVWVPGRKKSHLRRNIYLIHSMCMK